MKATSGGVVLPTFMTSFSSSYKCIYYYSVIAKIFIYSNCQMVNLTISVLVLFLTMRRKDRSLICLITRLLHQSSLLYFAGPPNPSLSAYYKQGVCYLRFKLLSNVKYFVLLKKRVHLFQFLDPLLSKRTNQSFNKKI